MSKKSTKPFGGAKIVYAASIVKESVQDATMFNGINYLERPRTPMGDDAIEYYTNTVDYNAYHARCLRLKADVSVGLGMSIVSGSAGMMKRLEVVNDHGDSFIEVISRVALDYETTGNGYLEIVVGRGGKIVEYYFMPSRRVYRRPRGADSAYYYANNESGALIPMQGYKFGEPREAGSYIMSFAQYSQTCVNYGLPDWRGAVSDIELDYYSMLYNQKFFINSGIPDLAIVVEGGSFDKDTQDAVTSFLSSNIKGVNNAHKTLYLPISSPDVKVKFEKLGMDVPKDASFDTLRARCRDNIVSAHGVCPRLVGIVTAGALGGGGEATGQLKTFQEISIAPRQSMWATKLQGPLSEMGMGTVEVMFNEMDTNIQENPSQYYPAMIGAGVLTVEKSREELGYEIVMIGDDKAKKEKEQAAEKVKLVDDVGEPVIDALEKLSKALDG